MGTEETKSARKTLDCSHVSVCRIKSKGANSSRNRIREGVQQGSALSPLLFITVMEEATKLARGDGPWELLYADDLVLTAE